MVQIAAWDRVCRVNEDPLEPLLSFEKDSRNHGQENIFISQQEGVSQDLALHCLNPVVPLGAEMHELHTVLSDVCTSSILLSIEQFMTCLVEPQNSPLKTCRASPLIGSWNTGERPSLCSSSGLSVPYCSLANSSL